MKILFVTRWFAPRNIIGAVRPTQLCKYFAENGNTVVCVSETHAAQKTFDETLHPIKVVRVNTGRIGTYRSSRSKQITETRNPQSVNNATKRSSKKRMKAIRKHISSLINVLDEIEWSKNAFKMIKRLLSDYRPDVIVTSYGPESSVLIGRRIKKKYRSIVWVSDMRDPMTHSQQLSWRKLLNGHWEKKMVKSADAITTISDALGDKYRRMDVKGRVGVFVNGFDPKDSCEDLSKKDGVLRIGYTGALYAGRRRMDGLFKAIESIEKSHGKQLPLEIHYAGNEATELFCQAKQYNVEKHIINHGILTRNDAQKLQEECDILCVLSWNTHEEKGVLTGKFPEYLRLRKTILALISGEVPNAELTNRINSLQCGFSYEYCGGDKSLTSLVEWLKEMLNRKAAGEDLVDMNSTMLIDEYNYKHISEKYEKYLKDIIEEKGQVKT